MSNTNRPRIFGECSKCGRRFNYLAPAGKTSWSGKCTGCGMPVSATLAGAKPQADPDPTTSKSTIPKAGYRPPKKKETQDATTGTQDSSAGTGPNGAAPPVPGTDPAGEPEPAGTGEPAGEPEPASGAESPKQDEPPTRKTRRSSREREPIRERRGSYSHLGYPY